ncbi:8-oxo-dGTP diphosphatase ASCRUDRAFT_78733 [Ascoidea rubescens DSM 1968]|uniref:Nudix hydrolase domain-containing protein n=1 Tax=Ascoidea rubescens DSM 1968 TaxID=1344418 RepID=A0A1D2VQ11_9ASCO|nr:hypothetical protein ASCRUDRAFT_78733 [Ascoidea rubescens DSM 1968]ODV63686.1 hypothetical protein ASCRUDRAFT_78733 [Ascoidea rubescens DSM 1968]
MTNSTTEIAFLQNIKNYEPLYFNSNVKTSIYHKLPVSRRSSVLILLFLGKFGEIRVVLTRRSRSLNAFSGQISFPGGKAENGLESEWRTARREAFEEIGLSSNDSYLLNKFNIKIENLNYLPCFLSRTFLAVRPCIGIIKNNTTANSIPNLFDEYNVSSLNFTDHLKLNPGESSSVFSIPLRDLYDNKLTDINQLTKINKQNEFIKKRFIKTKWSGINWNYRSYVYPVSNSYNEIEWLDQIENLSSDEEFSDNIPMVNVNGNNNIKQTHENNKIHNSLSNNTDNIAQNDTIKINDVWGLTANILYELAQITYDGSNYWENKKKNSIGEEELIYYLFKNNQIQPGKRSSYETKMIRNDRNVTFNTVIPNNEFNYLKSIYT